MSLPGLYALGVLDRAIQKTTNPCWTNQQGHTPAEAARHHHLPGGAQTKNLLSQLKIRLVDLGLQTITHVITNASGVWTVQKGEVSGF